MTTPRAEAVALTTEKAFKEACEAFEREMWPNGPAHGSGSGVWAKHKPLIEAATYEGMDPLVASDIRDGRIPGLGPSQAERDWRELYRRRAEWAATILDRAGLDDDATPEQVIAALLAYRGEPEPPYHNLLTLASAATLEYGQSSGRVMPAMERLGLAVRLLTVFSPATPPWPKLPDGSPWPDKEELNDD